MELSKLLKIYKKSRLSKQKGFSLVELMVVVAIIGILAAIAIPNYQKFQRRARQTEAKTMLASMYTVQTTFIAEYGLGTPNLLQMGFTPGGQVSYLTGFDGSEGDDGTISAGGTLNINKLAGSRPVGYTGPMATNVDHVNTFNLCKVADGGFNDAASITSCQVPLGASKDTGGSNLDISNMIGGCAPSTPAPASGCNFNLGTQVCEKVVATDSGSCNSSGPAIINTARNTVNFTIGSMGNIGGQRADHWIMDQAKNLANTQNGVE